MTDRIRLDQLLVHRGLCDSRARARDAIKRETVRLGGVLVTKPGQSVTIDANVSIDDPAASYVSRAALKLISGLEAFPMDVAGAVCLDIGASTGGFTQVLLERGAAKVHAIDVGHNQLNEKLAHDPRVARRDGLNARNLTRDDLTGDAPHILVSDVSFISLRLALPRALDLAAPGAQAIFLVKPQFEAGRAAIGKGGLVAPDIAETCAEDIRLWLDTHPLWSVRGLAPSPICGGDGNHEWLLAASKAV